MRRKGSFLFLVLSVALGLAAAYVAVKTVRGYNEVAAAVVAEKDILPYTRVAPEDVKVKEVPLAALPPDAILDPEEAVGKYLDSKVLAGEVLRKPRLADVRPDRGVLSARLSELESPRLRAFALPYDRNTAAGGEIREGDRVDLVASVKIDTGQKSLGVGKIIGRNKLVLRVIPGEQGKGTVVLALTPAEIEDVAFALTSGEVRLALNPYDTDETAAATPGVTGESWLKKFGFGVPAPAPAGGIVP